MGLLSSSMRSKRSKALGRPRVCSSRRTSSGKPAWTIVISVPPSRGSKLNSIEVSKLEPSSRVSVVVSRIRRGRSIASNTWRWW